MYFLEQIETIELLDRHLYHALEWVVVNTNDKDALFEVLELN